MLWRLTFAAGIVLCLAIGFVGTIMMIDERTPPAQPRERVVVVQDAITVPQATKTTASQQPSGTRCELTFPVRGCPAHPQFMGVDERNVYVDDYQGSGSNEARCLQRAREYYEFCKFDRAVTAKFYSNGVAVAVQSWPR